MATEWRRGSATVVHNLDQFRRDLRVVDQRFTKELRVAHREVAERIVAVADANARRLGGVHSKAADSLKALGEGSQAVVRLGGVSWPFAMGAEFGALQYPQFPPWRGNGMEAGYFLHPAIRDSRDEVMDLYHDHIGRIARAAFPAA